MLCSRQWFQTWVMVCLWLWWTWLPQILCQTLQTETINEHEFRTELLILQSHYWEARVVSPACSQASFGLFLVFSEQKCSWYMAELYTLSCQCQGLGWISLHIVVYQEAEEEKVIFLEDIFRKTEAVPSIYWLPLTEEQIAAKAKAKTSERPEPVNGNTKSKAVEPKPDGVKVKEERPSSKERPSEKAQKEVKREERPSIKEQAKPSVRTERASEKEKISNKEKVSEKEKISEKEKVTEKTRDGRRDRETVDRSHRDSRREERSARDERYPRDERPIRHDDRHGEERRRRSWVSKSCTC